MQGAPPGVRVLMADLGGHRRTVAGVEPVAAHRVHRVPHHGGDGRARGEPPVGRIWRSGAEPLGGPEADGDAATGRRG